MKIERIEKLKEVEVRHLKAGDCFELNNIIYLHLGHEDHCGFCAIFNLTNNFMDGIGWKTPVTPLNVKLVVE